MTTGTEFEKALASLAGKTVWSVLASSTTGSALTIEFGAKRPQAKPLVNPHLTEEERNYEGELGLHVTCAWRLEDEHAVICGSDDNAPYTFEMEQGLKRLIGDMVSKVRVNTPGYDLVISFSSGLRIRLFCDRTNSENANNYCFFGEDQIFAVGNKSHIAIEPRDETE